MFCVSCFIQIPLPHSFFALHTTNAGWGFMCLKIDIQMNYLSAKSQKSVQSSASAEENRNKPTQQPTTMPPACYLASVPALSAKEKEEIINRLSRAGFQWTDTFSTKFHRIVSDNFMGSLKVELHFGNFKAQAYIGQSNWLEKVPQRTVLSEGNSACIYALDFGSQRLVIKSIKIIHEASIDEALREVFLVKLASALEVGPQHSSLMGYDLLVTKDHAQFAMERCLVQTEEIWMKGMMQSLEDRGAKSSRQLLQEKFKKNCLAALRVIHGFRLVHRDIKPDNIGWSMRVNKFVLFDWGFSTFISQRPGQPSLTHFIGTAAFASTEMKKLYLLGQKGEVDLYINDLFCLDSSVEVHSSGQGMQVQRLQQDFSWEWHQYYLLKQFEHSLFCGHLERAQQILKKSQAKKALLQISNMFKHRKGQKIASFAKYFPDGLFEEKQKGNTKSQTYFYQTFYHDIIKNEQESCLFSLGLEEALEHPDLLRRAWDKKYLMDQIYSFFLESVAPQTYKDKILGRIFEIIFPGQKSLSSTKKFVTILDILSNYFNSKGQIEKEKTITSCLYGLQATRLYRISMLRTLNSLRQKNPQIYFRELFYCIVLASKGKLDENYILLSELRQNFSEFVDKNKKMVESGMGLFLIHAFQYFCLQVSSSHYGQPESSCSICVEQAKALSVLKSSIPVSENHEKVLEEIKWAFNPNNIHPPNLKSTYKQGNRLRNYQEYSYVYGGIITQPSRCSKLEELASAYYQQIQFYLATQAHYERIALVVIMYLRTERSQVGIQKALPLLEQFESSIGEEDRLKGSFEIYDKYLAQKKEHPEFSPAILDRIMLKILELWRKIAEKVVVDKIRQQKLKMYEILRLKFQGDEASEAEADALLDRYLDEYGQTAVQQEYLDFFPFVQFFPSQKEELCLKYYKIILGIFERMKEKERFYAKPRLLRQMSVIKAYEHEGRIWDIFLFFIEYQHDEGLAEQKYEGRRLGLCFQGASIYFTPEMQSKCLDYLLTRRKLSISDLSRSNQHSYILFACRKLNSHSRFAPTLQERQRLLVLIAMGTQREEFDYEHKLKQRRYIYREYIDLRNCKSWRKETLLLRRAHAIKNLQKSSKWFHKLCARLKKQKKEVGSSLQAKVSKIS